MSEPSSANENLLDKAISHALLVERYKAHEVRRIVKFLDEVVLPDLAARLAARLENIASRGFDVGFRTTARLRALSADLRTFFDKLAARLRAETEGDLTSFGEAQAAQLAKDIKREVAQLASVATPSSGAIANAILRRPFDGALLRERWAGRARSFRLAVEQQVRIGLVQGETPTAIVARVRAIWPAQRRYVAATVQTAVSHANAQARQAVFEANRDILDGVMITATLDLSTCIFCADGDGKVYPVDSGPRPPFHLGPCRCQPVPILKSAKDLGFGRGDLANETRASMDGQVPDATTFAEWIARQSAERQDEVFGPGRAALFRAGKVALADMVNAAGRVLSLGELTAMLAG